MYNSIDVAEYIIDYRNKKSLKTTNLRLQRILFFLQTYWIETFNTILFENNFEVWAYGFVEPSSYFEFSINMGYPITLTTGPKNPNLIYNSDKNIISNFIDMQENYSTKELVEMTQQCPVWKNSRKNSVITNEMIKAFLQKNHSYTFFYNI